jgi:hypothetical protein
MIRIYFPNFQYYSQNEGKDLEEAKEIARKAGFECRFETEDGEILGSWSIIGGFRKQYPLWAGLIHQFDLG